jgi:hypothetical protein
MIDPDAGSAGQGQGGVGQGSAGQGGDQGTAGPQLPCDVDAILYKNCSDCHSKSLAYGAPIPLVTYANLTASWKGRKVYEVVQQRVHDNKSPMPPAPYPRLDAQALATIDAWVAGGVKPGTAVCSHSGGGSSNATPPLPCTPDQFVRPASPMFIPQGISDLYFYYGFDTPVTRDRHVIAIAPHVDNKAVLHHLRLYQADLPIPTTPIPFDGALSLIWRLYGGWVPGMGNIILPPPAGVRESALFGATHWVVEVHLNNSGGLPGQSDASGFDFCTTDQLRPNDAEVAGFGTIAIVIPPHAQIDIGSTWLSLEDMHVFSVAAHMHKLGRAMTTTIHRFGKEVPIPFLNIDVPIGTWDIPLLNAPSFDFNSQVIYPADVEIKPGDIVENHCVYDNTTDLPEFFGESTHEEMCFDFAFYYPKVPIPGWTWATPALTSIPF